jgi:polar amino acid transport system permease protein
MATSGVSAIVVLGGLAALIVTSPGWYKVRDSFFSTSAFSDSFGSVLSGFWLDVKLFMIVEVCVLVLGLLIALCRSSTTPALFPLRVVAVAFVDVFRGLPTILVVYLIGFGVPGLALSGVPTSVTFLGGFALTLSYSGYVAEVYRAGIQSIHPSQVGAGLAVGLTRAQTFRHVVLPQAVRRVVPPLLNDFIALQKDAALVSLIGPIEAFRAAQIYADRTFNSTSLIAAGLLYLCVTIPFTRLADYLIARSAFEQGTALALAPK